MTACGPLAGLTVVWTGTRGSGSGIIEALESAGATVHRSSLVEITRVHHPRGMLAALEALGPDDWVLFTSGHAVRSLPRVEPPVARVGAVGPATAKELRRIGWTTDLVAEPSTARSLARSVAERSARGTQMVFLKGERARPDLERALGDLGFDVEGIVVYESRPVSAEEAKETVRFLKSTTRPVVMMGSPLAVEALAKGAPGGFLGQISSEITWVCLGSTTRSALERNGVRRVLVPPQPLPEEIVEMLKGNSH